MAGEESKEEKSNTDNCCEVSIADCNLSAVLAANQLTNKFIKISTDHSFASLNHVKQLFALVEQTSSTYIQKDYRYRSLQRPKYVQNQSFLI